MKAAVTQSFRGVSAKSLASPVQFSLLKHLELSPREPDNPAQDGSAVKQAIRKSKYLSHESVVDSIRQAKNADQALHIFDKASVQRGFQHNNSTYAILLYKLAQFHRYDSVDAVVHRMSLEACRFHEGIFLVLMKHFSKWSMHDRVIEMFHHIQPIVRSKPSMKAISTCLNLLVEAKEIGLARNFLLSTHKDFQLEPNSCIFNIVVKYHCKNGDIDSAFDLVKEMEKSQVSCPNLITYSTLIDGLSRAGRLREAVDLMEEMISKHQILPDALTYNLLISGFCQRGKAEEAKKIMEFMRKHQCHPNIFNYSTLMNGLCIDGKIEEAKELLKEMKVDGLRPDAVVYTTLINFICRAGRTTEAIELLEVMNATNCKPDVVTFNVILGGLCRERRFNEAFNMLRGLQKQGVYLNNASYRIVLNFLCKEGEMEKAMDMLVMMLRRGFVPHFGTSNGILVGLCTAGRAHDAVTALFGLAEMGFRPDTNTWSTLVDLHIRERMVLPAFQLLDSLLIDAEPVR